VPEPPPALACRGLCFGYRAKPLLRDVSLDIPRGGLFCIAGPNGAGKSTLLRLLSGALRAESGSVLLDGADIAAIPPSQRARRIALVPQTEMPAFPYSVRAMVLFGRHPWLSGFGLERAEDFAVVDEALRLLGIGHLAQRSVTELSGGEYHRVSIARALAQATPVLLLDEPNAHLDLRAQHELFRVLDALHRARGRTVVCVTHDLDLAARYADSIALFAEGRLLALGPPREVITADSIRACYGVEAGVVVLPDGAPHVVPAS
jgi:iron complex transport system ATP-binding protein